MGFFNHIRVLFQSRVGARGSPRQPRVTNTAGTEYKLRVSCSLNEKSGFAPRTTDVGERSGCVTIKTEPRSGDSSDKDGSDDRQLEKQQWMNKHQCRFCPYSSSYSPNVTRHEKQHTGRKPFSCRYCRRSFSQKTALENHEKLHTSDKPFRCRTCYKAFKLRTSLVRHERIHTGERQSSKLHRLPVITSATLMLQCTIPRWAPATSAQEIYFFKDLNNARPPDQVDNDDDRAIQP
ncbi:zinc finger protein 135 [Ixodes scapularis]